MSNFINSFITLVGGYKIITILILIAVDFLLGVIVAIKNGAFKLSKIGSFLNTSVLYYLGGYLLLGVAGTAEPGIGTGLIISAFALLDATMLGSIFEKVGKLGIPVPAPTTTVTPAPSNPPINPPGASAS